MLTSMAEDKTPPCLATPKTFEGVVLESCHEHSVVPHRLRQRPGFR
jgi:hypothetical protein